MFEAYKDPEHLRFLGSVAHGSPADTLRYIEGGSSAASCFRSRSPGVPGEQSERVGACTHASPEFYFSFRRDGAGIGQQLSFIGLR